MAKFEVMSLSEAKMKSGTPRQQEILREYREYIQKVQPGQAGKLIASSSESLRAVRRRLTAAAKSLNKALVVKRGQNEVYFWVKDGPRRRGRPRKNPA
ncbi:MAG: hypothetical protein HY261_05435 [Chloroflexi bacterium]|nr:hypothetical protein [Chloroflexota bacterium]